MRGVHQWQVCGFPSQRASYGEMFPFDDVIMLCDDGFNAIITTIDMLDAHQRAMEPVDIIQVIDNLTV